MSIVDSEAAFAQHCAVVDKTGHLLATLKASNIDTYSKLTFSIGSPQKPPSDDEFNAFCTLLNNGVDMSIAEAAAVKRIHFESLTIVVANLKSKASADAATSVQKIPNAEKQARLMTQQRRLNGISITGELQPSHVLIDLVASMCDTNFVVWVPPSKCSKREAEVQMTSKDKTSLVSVEQQMLKIANPEPDIKVDTSTELQLQWAFMRRGIAFDQCGLINWDSHQAWVHQLLSLVTKEAPSGYNKISIDQLVRADKELFTIMSQELQVQDVRLDHTSKPMNMSLNTLRTDPRVTMHLLPLMHRGRGSADDSKGSNSKAASQQDPKGRKHGANKINKAPFKPSKRVKDLCPVELKQYKLADSDNNPICWAFNLSKGCQETVTNGRCKKGMHKCIKCHRANHSLSTCRAAAAATP